MKLSMIAVCGALTAGLCLPGVADVRYTTSMSSAPGVPPILTTTYVKGKRERVETVTEMGTFKTVTTTLTMCDKHKTYQVDDELKLYTEMSMQGAPLSAAAPGGTPGKGTITNTYKVDDLGQEKVADLMSHHWKMAIRVQSSGCAGNSDVTSNLEFWTAKIPVLNCPERTGEYSYDQGPCKVSVVLKGDVDKMRKAFDGMIVKQLVYQDGKVVSTTQLKDYSSAALADKLFEIPADYKLVSAAEFQAAQQQKMMKHFQPPGN